MKKAILFAICLIVSSYMSTASAKRHVKLPSNSHIIKVIKHKLLLDTNDAELVGFEKSHDGGSVYCHNFAVDNVKIVRKEKLGAVIDTFDNSYVHSVFNVYFKVKGSCKLDGPAKVRNKGHQKVIVGRVPFLNSTYHVAIKSYNGRSKWHIDSKVFPTRKSRAKKEAYRLNYYNKYGKGLEYDPGEGRYDNRYDKSIITTPRSRLESAIREHPNKNETKLLLAIINRNQSLRKHLLSLSPYPKQQRFGRQVLYKIKGISDPKRQDEAALALIDELKNATLKKELKKSIVTRIARKTAKDISIAMQGSPFKLSKRFYAVGTKSNLAKKVCISEFGSNYRLASWKNVINYYTPSKIKEIKVLKSRYYILFEGSELSKYNKKYHHIFHFLTDGRTPKNDVVAASKLSALCADKRSQVASVKTSSAVSSKTLLHSHNSRTHSHKLPRQGKAHRHGNGAIGK